MTAIDVRPTRNGAGALRRRAALDALSDAADWALVKVHEWRQRSRERAELAMLDDRMLRDIGLTHADREFLANKPFWKE